MAAATAARPSRRCRKSSIGLRAKGYQFVSVSDLLGQTRAQVMPPLSHAEWLLVRADAFIFDVFRWTRARHRLHFHGRNFAGRAGAR